VNWKEKSGNQTKEISKLQTSLNTLKAQVADAQTKLETATKDHQKATLEREGKIADLTAKIKEAESESTRASKALEDAQKNAQLALSEATAKKGQIDVLNETIAKAQDQANKYSGQNIELTDRIRILEREKETAELNAKDLRTFVGRTTAFLRQKGIPFDGIDKFDPSTVPPPVEGIVKEINATNRSMEISIGSDDGLAIGQEFYVFRTKPKAEYLGKVKIVAVYPDKAVADVIGQTVNRKKIQEGDIVSSTINAR
jgi:chromosome segregation ATPase